MSDKSSAVRLNPNINKLLADLVIDEKVNNPGLTANKQSIVAMLIIRAHKKQIRNGD